MLKRLRPRGDAGLGVVEIMVSMTLIAIILMAVAPLLINAMRTSHRNATVAFATQVVNERIELARAASGSCSDFLTRLANPGPGEVQDGRGVRLTITQVPAPSAPPVCDATHRLQQITVTATATVTGLEAATATTVIAVPGLD